MNYIIQNYTSKWQEEEYLKQELISLLSKAVYNPRKPKSYKQKSKDRKKKVQSRKSKRRNKI